MSETVDLSYAGQALISRLSLQYVMAGSSEGVVPFRKLRPAVCFCPHVYNLNSPSSHTAGTASRIGVDLSPPQFARKSARSALRPGDVCAKAVPGGTCHAVG